MRILPLLGLVLLPVATAFAAPGVPWPTKAWPTSTPEAEGLEPAAR